MSTPDLRNTVNGPEFASISALADRLGVDKAVVSRKVARLEEQGLLETRSAGPGKPKLVDVAAYLRASKQTFDAVRAANSAKARSSPSDTGDKVLSKEQARRVAIQADLAQIKLDVERGLLVTVEEVRDAMATAASELVRVLEMLPARAGDLAAAILRDGEQGARAALKELAREARERLEASMALLAAEEPEDGD